MKDATAAHHPGTRGHPLNHKPTIINSSRQLCISLLIAWCSLSPGLLAADNRQVYTGARYPWLTAIGKLQVPAQRYEEGRIKHYIEDCSATLVAGEGSASANFIITAWHCLESYSDLSRPIVFTLKPDGQVPIMREAYRLASGGSMKADWAILRLYKSVAAREVKPLAIDTARARRDQAIIMAGYSRDNGAGGQLLSFDPACMITHQDPGFSDTNCTAYKGASGGPAIQISDGGTPLVYGVISQGDGVGRSTFFPAHGFRTAIRQHLR